MIIHTRKNKKRGEKKEKRLEDGDLILATVLVGATPSESRRPIWWQERPGWCQWDHRRLLVRDDHRHHPHQHGKKERRHLFFSTNTPLSIDAHDLVTVRAGRKGAADAHLRQPTMALIIIKTDEKWQRNGTARRPPVSSAATTTLIYFNTFFSLRRGERIEEIHTHTSIPPDGACFFLFFSFPSRPPSLLRS